MRFAQTSKSRRPSLMDDYADRLGAAVSHKHLEVALRAAKTDAELASHAKSAFMANMRHELRTPLNAIIGFSELLKMTDPDAVDGAQAVQYAGFIRQSADRLLNSVNDILDISAFEAGLVSLIVEPTDLSALFNGALDDLSEVAADKRVRLVRYIPDAPVIRHRRGE